MINRWVSLPLLIALTAAAPADDLSRLRARLVELAAQERAGVAKAQTVAARLSALNAAEADLKARTGANQRSLTRLLGALQSYRRNPPPALLVSPRSAKDAVQAAILMRAIAPELQRRAQHLAQEGKALNALRREILIADGEFLGAEHDVADRRAEIEALAEEKLRLEGPADPALTARADAVGRATAVDSVGAVVTGIMTPDVATTSPMEGSSIRLIPPASGPPARRFGDAFPGHGRTQGWSWRAPEGAVVVSPTAGRVVYARPLKGWGFVVILSTPGGYHLVLAGLERAIAREGGEMAAGEPVGRLAKPVVIDPKQPPTAPEIYLEIRKGAKPLDPAPFFAAKSG